MTTPWTPPSRERDWSRPDIDDEFLFGPDRREQQRLYDERVAERRINPVPVEVERRVGERRKGLLVRIQELLAEIEGEKA